MSETKPIVSVNPYLGKICSLIRALCPRFDESKFPKIPLCQRGNEGDFFSYSVRDATLRGFEKGSPLIAQDGNGEFEKFSLDSFQPRFVHLLPFDISRRGAMHFFDFDVG